MSKDYRQKETNRAATEICNVCKAHGREKARFIANLNKLQKQYQSHTNYGYDKHVKVATQDA